MIEDGYRHKGLRKQLVEELRRKGVTDPRVLEAIGKVPRHQFIDDTAFLELAYSDVAFPIGCGQTISQPYTVGMQSQLLRSAPGMRVLEIGTGCGYQTAVLVAMGLKVFSIERQRPLYIRTKERLARMRVRASLYYGDGYQGLAKEAPFDRVLVTCGAPFVPQPLLDQLKPGGIAVIPVGDGVQTMQVIERGPDGFITTEHGSFRFVPMLEERSG
jgi:protein-L-isoaspartate(D-aspartate) O-methyltransferase